MNNEALKAELTNDPEGRGYSGMSDAQAAASFATLDRERNVTTVSGQEIFEAVVAADYTALSADDRQLFLAIVGMGTILVNGTNTKTALTTMFAATPTLANLAALQTETVSRATELGLGLVKVGHIQEARNG